MTAHRGALPTLTEVIDVTADARMPVIGAAALPPESLPLEGNAPLPVDGRAGLTTQVLEALRPRLDVLLDARLQAALAPQLSRLADELVQSLRAELASTLQTLVTQAVDEVLARQRKA